MIIQFFHEIIFTFINQSYKMKFNLYLLKTFKILCINYTKKLTKPCRFHGENFF
jgi:hypothetical protein